MFTESERNTLATPLSIRLEHAIDQGDSNELETIVNLMNEESTLIYDSYNPWLGMLQTYLLEKAGRQAHRRAVLWAGEHALRPFVRQFESLSFKQRARKICRRLKAMGSVFHVAETDEVLRIKLDPWGAARQWRFPHPWQDDQPRNRTGRRIEFRNFGAYDELYPSDHERYQHPSTLSYVPGLDPLIHMRDQAPCFVVPEVLMYEIYPMELYGAPLAVIDLPEEPGEQTQFTLHKDPSAVPAEAYQRVGLSKPAGVNLPGTQGRVFRDEERNDLGVPCSIRVQEAAREGDAEALRAVARDYDRKLVSAKDPLSLMTAGLLSWIARHRGEDALEEAHRWSADVAMGPFVEVVDSLSMREQVELWATVWRAHGSTFWMEEDEERIRFRGKPLGACHRMWIDRRQWDFERISQDRIRYPTFDCYSPPASFHRMRGSRGITCGKTGYPVYSTQCHLTHEIYPIDRLGYPLWVEEHPLENPRDETVHLLYKDPDRWPDSYYERVNREQECPH